MFAWFKGLKIWALIALAFGFLALIAKSYMAGRKSAQADGMTDQLENVEKRNEVDARIDRAEPAERVRLRDKWTRD